MEKITIYLTKDEQQHLRENFDCASDACGRMYNILDKVRKQVKPRKIAWIGKSIKRRNVFKLGEVK